MGGLTRLRNSLKREPMGLRTQTSEKRHYSPPRMMIRSTPTPVSVHVPGLAGPRTWHRWLPGAPAFPVGVPG